jgi:hypothetical protein
MARTLHGKADDSIGIDSMGSPHLQRRIAGSATETNDVGASSNSYPPV